LQFKKVKNLIKKGCFCQKGFNAGACKGVVGQHGDAYVTWQQMAPATTALYQHTLHH